MRQLKQVILQAGKLKKLTPHLHEHQICLNALYMNVQSKLTALDLQYFETLLKDMFPGFAPAYVYEVDIREHVLATFKQNHLHANEALLEKVLSLYALVQNRFGVCLLGATLTGKSSVIQLLKDTLNRIPDLDPEKPRPVSIYKVQAETVNPKSVSVTELFGSIDPITKNWTDGVLSHCLRSMSENKTPELAQWCILDGPQDSLWIENLNTTLDDSRVLCLSNGERLKMLNTMRLLFETETMSAVSPATISRLGIVYFKGDLVSPLDVLNAQIQKMEEDLPVCVGMVRAFFEKHLSRLLELLAGFVCAFPVHGVVRFVLNE